MPRRTKRTQQHRAKADPSDRELARSFYEMAQFHDGHGRATEAVANYAAALQMDLEPSLRPYCRAYLAANLHQAGRSEEACRRANGVLRETDEPELRVFLTGLLERIKQASPLTLLSVDGEEKLKATVDVANMRGRST